MKKKNIIIFMSTFILLVLISIFFISYGFVMNKVNGNETAKTLTFKRSSIKIEFSNGNEELITNQDGYFVAGSTIRKSFNIKNTGSETVSYSIKLIDIVNPFTRVEDLTYELYLGNELISTNQFPTNKTEYIAYNQTLNVKEEKTYELVVKYKTSSENQIVDSGKSISATLDFEETID